MAETQTTRNDADFWIIYSEPCIYFKIKSLALQIKKRNEIMKHIRNAFFLLTTLVMLASCGEDRSGEYYALIGENLWIEQVMKEHYLWYDSIPEVEESDYFTDPEAFLQKLVYTKAQNGKGDSYSYIETKETSTAARSYLQRTSTYGFDFELMTDPTGASSHTFARILFVLPNSPASEAGLERGDWISAIGKVELTSSNYGYLMEGDNTAFARESLGLNELGELAWTALDTVEVTAARPVELNPFYVDTVYEVSGQKIAYMMYNEFSTGPDNQAADTEYREQMRQIFARFKSQSPDAFILDLRYNPGGYLSCATDLGSYLAPAADLGKVFCTTAYNDISDPQQVDFLFNTGLSSENLDLDRLYVLTSKFTASASEAVINCLRPYIGTENVVVIGETTEGKNVAMEPYQDERYNYILWPVVAYVLNSEGQANYANGITPDFTLSERNLVSNLYPLGDTQEYLLKNTIAYITTGSMPDLAQPEEQALEGRTIYNSLTRRSMKGIRLR